MEQTNKCKLIKYVLSYSNIREHVLVLLPKTTASTLLPFNLPAPHALVSVDLCYGTHLYLTGM